MGFTFKKNKGTFEILNRITSPIQHFKHLAHEKNSTPFSNKNQAITPPKNNAGINGWNILPRFNSRFGGFYISIFSVAKYACFWKRCNFSFISGIEFSKINKN